MARTDFVLPGYLAMLNEIARLLKQPDLAKQPEEERARLLIEALAPAQALLILDNLESLAKDDQNRLFEFLSQLPPGCKAIVTSRRRTDVDARIIRLARLDRDAALALIAALATDRPLLAKASAAERSHLYEETGGNPLLLRWIAGQLGKGRCRTVARALDFLRSAPEDNDPLEFIFGDLLETFTDSETAALAALSYFTREVEVKLIAELAGLSKTAVEAALGDLSSRALVVPDEEEKNFALVPMVADFLRKKRPEAVAETGQRLEKRAFALIVENGWEEHVRFSVLDAAWPTVAPALPIFLSGPNSRLQTVCDALRFFLDFTGRWDEWLSLCSEAEARAVAAGDRLTAGWLVYQAGCVYSRRGYAEDLLACADRAEQHWQRARAGTREQGTCIHMRGLALQIMKDYRAAIKAYGEALALYRKLPVERHEVAFVLNDLAAAEELSGDLDAAERRYLEAMRVAQKMCYAQGIAKYTGNLAGISLRRKEWKKAETLAREALALSVDIGRQDLVAADCHRLAKALLRNGRAADALPYARRAVVLYTRLAQPDLDDARATLTECREALLSGLSVGWTYNTTTLEGNTLTEAEVAEVLAKPKAKIAKRPAEHVAAVRAQQAAIQAVGRWLGEDRPFTKDDLFALHTVLMQGSTVDSMKPIGAWKIEDNGTPVRLGGKSRWNDNYAAAQHTGALMETWLTAFNQRREGAGEPFEDYLWLHATFARIHPFADGNGRLARLLANVPLVASGQPVVDIPATAKDRYLAALARWQFACGAPRPNAPLYTKAGELKDFIALCKASQAKAATSRKKAPKTPQRRGKASDEAG